MGLRIVGVWLLLMVVAILNGTARNAWLTPALGAPGAHVASTIVLSALIFGVAWQTTPWINPRSSGDAWRVGRSWLLMTVGFELLAGHFVFGHPWEALLADYDLTRGRIWPLVLMTTLLAPPLAFRLRRAAARGSATAPDR